MIGPALTKDQVELTLRGKAEAGGAVVFVSRSGHMAGMDSDSVVSFEADHGVVLGEYGIAPQGYRGSYAVAADGSITLSLKGYDSTWPAMKVVAHGSDLWLYPVDPHVGFVMGERGGATETGGMLSFWPFKWVKGGKSPTVTPVYTGGHVKVFVSPVLPPDFGWHGDSFEFRVAFDVSETGAVKASGYSTSETRSNSYEKGDWRLPAVKCAMEAVGKWEFYPRLADDQAVPAGGGWNFIVRREGQQIHWMVKDDTITVYDNMPRETIRAAASKR